MRVARAQLEGLVRTGLEPASEDANAHHVEQARDLAIDNAEELAEDGGLSLELLSLAVFCAWFGAEQEYYRNQDSTHWMLGLESFMTETARRYVKLHGHEGARDALERVRNAVGLALPAHSHLAENQNHA
jgi:hypothetical protein